MPAKAGTTSYVLPSIDEIDSSFWPHLVLRLVISLVNLSQSGDVVETSVRLFCNSFILAFIVFRSLSSCFTLGASSAAVFPTVPRLFTSLNRSDCNSGTYIPSIFCPFMYPL